MCNRALVGLGLGGLLSGLCLWYAFRSVDFTALLENMGRVGVGVVAASVFGCLLSLALRAFRWRLLLDGGARVASSSLLSATFIGMMANNLLPARLGEVVRAWVLAQREQTRVTPVFASIVLERILDTVALVAVLGLALMWSPRISGPGSAVFRQVGNVSFLFSVAIVTGLLIVVRYQDLIHERVDRLASRDQSPWKLRTLDLFRRFIEGLCVLRGAGQTVKAAVFSLLIWAVGIWSFHVLAQGFDLGLTATQSTLVFVAVLFGIAIPSAPGYVGTFHGFCVAALTLVAGTEPTLAAAYATLLHGTQWLAINLVGLTCLAADRTVTWSTVAAAVKQS